ncbi:hypothetical protein LSPH24S_02195 [Lysinibacillus sphaericus]
MLQFSLKQNQIQQIKNIEDGIAVYHAENCDSIVSLGGGSAHDAAKGIGLIASMVEHS